MKQMRQSHVVLINTISLYAKIIVNALVMLFSTRIALDALGADSFGLYNLIAGVISMLAFFNGALMVSSQRFLSYAMGEKNEEKLYDVFNISFYVHLILALALVIVFKLIQPLLFGGLLNIERGMIDTALRVFNVMIISSFVTILAIPYNAAINAHEEMWFFTISEIITTLLKLGAAVYLLYTPYDLLLTYTVLMLVAITVGALIKFLWCRFRYPETRISLIKRRKIDKTLFKEMFGFAGWNTFGSLSMVARNQGIAVILNIFFGTVVNAAYGVANQLNALVITFAGTLTTVFTPMIVKAKGEGNHERMLSISIFSSKMSFFLSSVLAIPALLFTPFILSLWLKEIPEYTIEFSQAIIVSFVITQLYPGITRAIYAQGDIKWYQIIISLILILNLPIGYWLFYSGFSPVSILITLVFFQVLSLIFTIYMAKIKVGLNTNKFYFYSVIRPVFLFLFILITFYFVNQKIEVTNELVNFVLSSIASSFLFLILYYKLVLSQTEKNLLINLLKSLKTKVLKK